MAINQFCLTRIDLTCRDYHLVIYSECVLTHCPPLYPTGHTEAVTGLAFDPTGSNLASCSADMSAKIWDLATYTCIKTLKVRYLCFLLRSNVSVNGSR